MKLYLHISDSTELFRFRCWAVDSSGCCQRNTGKYLVSCTAKKSFKIDKEQGDNPATPHRSRPQQSSQQLIEFVLLSYALMISYRNQWRHFTKMIRQSTSRNSDSKVSSATSAFLRFNLCFETFDTPIRRQSVKLPQMSNKPIELDLPGRLFLIGKGSLKAGSQTAVKIEVWSYMGRSGFPYRGEW